MKIINTTKYKTTIIKHLLYLAVALTIGGGIAYAGTLTPPGAPADTMYTLDNIYNLATGATSTIGSGSIPATPGSVSPTFHDLTQVYTALSTQISNLSSSTIATGTTAFGITGTKLPSKLLQTFGTSDFCTDNNGNVISCAGSGEDGQYQKGQPHSYTDNGDGTITDNDTGLMWQKCTVGLSGTNCGTGSASTLTFAQATSTCMTLSLGSHTDWRVPNMNELLSLETYENANGVNTTYFPNSSTVIAYFSSTQVPAYPASVVGWYFSVGTIGFNKTSSTAILRCVRG